MKSQGGGVIQGYLPLLTRPEHIVHFFRDVHGVYPITPQVLAKRTLEYRGWVEGYARNHKIPILKAEKAVSKEDAVRPYLERMERRNQHGVSLRENSESRILRSGYARN